jgi:hypothetical protein
MDMKDIGEAHNLIMSGKSVGKIVIRTWVSGEFESNERDHGSRYIFHKRTKDTHTHLISYPRLANKYKV